MKNTPNLARIIKKEHENKWVALSKDYKKILGYSEDLIDLRSKMGDKEDVTYLKMPESGRRYAF